MDWATSCDHKGHKGRPRPGDTNMHSNKDTNRSATQTNKGPNLHQISIHNHSEGSPTTRSTLYASPHNCRSSVRPSSSGLQRFEAPPRECDRYVGQRPLLIAGQAQHRRLLCKELSLERASFSTPFTVPRMQVLRTLGVMIHSNSPWDRRRSVTRCIVLIDSAPQHGTQKAPTSYDLLR